MPLNRKQHWEKVYATNASTEVSWYQANPQTSLELITSTGLGQSGKIIDVGGGASLLVDKLLDQGCAHLTVLDISSKAIEYAKERLGEFSKKVTWIVSDITEFTPSSTYDLWHDRAVFHFLTAPKDREKYIEVMTKAVRPGGHIIIAAFALDGPPQCSDLDVERYDCAKLKKELGGHYEFIAKADEEHVTPGQSKQKFLYCCFKRRMYTHDSC